LTNPNVHQKEVAGSIDTADIRILVGNETHNCEVPELADFEVPDGKRANTIALESVEPIRTCDLPPGVVGNTH
jgi:hypothetical protein